MSELPKDIVHLLEHAIACDKRYFAVCGNHDYTIEVRDRRAGEAMRADAILLKTLKVWRENR